MEIQRRLLHKSRSIRDLVFQPPTQGKIPSRAAMMVFLATDLAERRCRAPRSTTLQAIFIIPTCLETRYHRSHFSLPQITRFFALACFQSTLPLVEPMILVLNPSSRCSYTTAGLAYTIRVRPTAVFGGPRWEWHVLS